MPHNSKIAAHVKMITLIMLCHHEFDNKKTYVDYIRLHMHDKLSVSLKTELSVCKQ